MKRMTEVCREKQCYRFERYGTPPINSTNYCCLYADAFRFDSKEKYENQEVPDDCPYKESHKN